METLYIWGDARNVAPFILAMGRQGFTNLLIEGMNLVQLSFTISVKQVVAVECPTKGNEPKFDPWEWIKRISAVIGIVSGIIMIWLLIFSS